MNPNPHDLIAAFDGEHLLADLDTLGAIGLQGGAGLQRMAYGAADLQGRAWVLAQMQALGMDASIDAAGNVVGRYAGREDLPAIALGSHTDSVPGGGKFDGALGVLGALACIRTLHDAGARLRHPLLVIDFAAEEATTSASPMGSLSFIGRLDAAALEGPAWQEQSTRALLETTGFDLGAMVANRPPMPIAAFLELHIEQGEHLAERGIPIGIVEGIVGIRRYYVTFMGQANHAGTTGMARRRDALVMAAPFISAVRDVGDPPRHRRHHRPAGRASRRAQRHPRPRHARPGDPRHGQRRARHGRARTGRAGRGRGRRLCPRQPQGAGAGRAAAHGCHRTCLPGESGWPSRAMPSGAGHDAMNMAALCPYAMIFVPSQDGISHAPEEFTHAHDCVNGGRVLFATLLDLDESL